MPRGCYLFFFGGDFENSAEHFSGDIQKIKNDSLLLFWERQNDLKELLIALCKLQAELLILRIFR